jgi:hypothetical protein
MKYSHSKNSSFFYKKLHLFNSHLVNLQNSNSKLNKKDRDISFDISLTSTYNKFNTLNKTEKSTKDSKFIHNISAPSIYNYKSKHYNIYENNIQKHKKMPNSIINPTKKTKILKIISQIKKRNNNINNVHALSKNEPVIRIQNNKNHLKLSSEFNRKNKSKDCIISSSKKESGSYKKKINFKNMRNLNPNIKDNSSTKKFKDINKEANLNEGCNSIARTKFRYGSIYNNIKINKNSKNKRMLEYEKKIKLRNKNKNFLIKKNKKLKKTVSKDNSTKFNSIYLSPNRLNEISSSKNLFLNKIKNNYNSNSTKNIFANSKIIEKKSIKNDNTNININYDNYTTKSHKKITVNLNHTNINLKKKQNKLRMSNSIKDNIHINQYNHSQSQIFLSSLSPKLTKTHENSLSILSSKDIFKKNNSQDKKEFEILSYKESRFSIESLNKFRYDQNLQDITQESKEANEILDLLKNKLDNLKNNYSLYLNDEKKNYISSPDGPEDFHFRFVELCKQNNSFYRNFYLNTINGDEKDKKNKDFNIKDEDITNNYQEYFENYGDKVPYI